MQGREEESGVSLKRGWCGGSVTCTVYFLQGLDGIRDGQQVRRRKEDVWHAGVLAPSEVISHHCLS